LPGAGFLNWATGEGFHLWSHIGLAILTVAGFAVTAGLWFATGNVLLPPLYWLLTAVAAAAMAHGTASPAALPVTLAAAVTIAAVAFLGRLAMLVWGRQRRSTTNRHLVTAVRPLTTPPPGELTLDDLKRARLLIDRALQPLDRFDGFEFIDQFQTAAVRYQLNHLGYGLSLLQHQHTPAFQGYLTAAQRNLALKQLDHRVWEYWALENLWGNLRRSADPIGRDNIMFTGFTATQIAMFQAASGDQGFDQPGSLTFVHPDGRRFAHDFPGFVRQLLANIAESPFTLVACEPNWIYPLCNGIGGAAVKFANPAVWEEIAPRLTASIDREFLSASGRLVPCRSRYAGFALPALGGTVVQSLPCFFYNAAIPRIAERHWLMERANFIQGGELVRRRFWPVDVGNYGFSRAASFAGTAAAAAEMGDGEALSLLLDALAHDCPEIESEGVRHRPAASLWSHGVELMARAGGADVFRDMIAKGPSSRTPGPFIAEASYPAVLVAKAREHAHRLEAVFYTGLAHGPQQIQIGGLKPSQRYRWSGGEIIASMEGTADLTLLLEGRTEFTLIPTT
jgi:hypothetical protein